VKQCQLLAVAVLQHISFWQWLCCNMSASGSGCAAAYQLLAVAVLHKCQFLRVAVLHKCQLLAAAVLQHVSFWQRLCCNMSAYGSDCAATCHLLAEAVLKHVSFWQ
jgi:hypothetical protein